MVENPSDGIQLRFTFFHNLQLVMQVYSAQSNFPIMFQLLVCSGFVHTCEMFPSNIRAVGNSFIGMGWTLSWIIMTLPAYYIRNWRVLQIIINSPAVIAILLTW